MMRNVSLLCATALLASATWAQSSDFDKGWNQASSSQLSADDAKQFLAWYGDKQATDGNAFKYDDLRFVFALKAEGVLVTAVSDDLTWSVTLHSVGNGLFTAATTLPEKTGFMWHYEVDGKKVGGAQLEAYTFPQEAKYQATNPHGDVIEQPMLHSGVFAGTTRHWYIYVPKQYDASKPACLMVVQDAQWQKGYWPMVIDNMLAENQMPVVIGVFITPGTIQKDLDNRSIEYDSVNDKYDQMLEKEILSQVYAKYNVRKEASAHLIAGVSSGGICAFNAAWQRPDMFSKVISWVGSFTNLQGGPDGFSGGNTFPARIRMQAGWDRKGEPKPIRVFLADGSNDLDNRAGNWPLANHEMAKALEFGHYDYQFKFGPGFHADKWGQSLLPDTLRWIWRDEPK